MSIYRPLLNAIGEFAISQGRLAKLPDLDGFSVPTFLDRAQKEHPEFFEDIPNYLKQMHITTPTALKRLRWDTVQVDKIDASGWRRSRPYSPYNNVERPVLADMRMSSLTPTSGLDWPLTSDSPSPPTPSRPRSS